MSNYFSQENMQPEPTKSVETSNQLVDVPALVRSSNSGDKIYFVEKGTKHWITSPEVLKQMGFEFGQEKEIDKDTMAQLQSGEPIRMQNVNEYTHPVEESVETVIEGETIEPTLNVDNSKVEGYFTVIIPVVLKSDNVDKVTAYVESLKKYFSGEIITVVRNTCNYNSFSNKFGHKVIECEDMIEGMGRAQRVARGVILEAYDIN